ncbi:MAG: deoxyhypusine synthase family protein [bacterium JZ-2024 1]
MRSQVIPFVPDRMSAAEYLDRASHLSYQARNLGIAFRIWKQMLGAPRNVIFLSLAGAMTAAGLRRTVSFLIRERLLDCLVSTGANLFHDVYETLGTPHYATHPAIGDQILFKHRLDRVYDTLADEKEFRRIDKMMAEFGRSLAKRFPSGLGTREFFYHLGAYLDPLKKEDGIITTAYRARVPVYCPALGDSSFGIGMSILCNGRESALKFDILKDVYETARLAGSGKNSSVLVVGGGVPKNFVQQVEVTADYLGLRVMGHSFAIQITTDAPHWGGLSGATFEEAESWGKIQAHAQRVTVYCDATIALTLLSAGLAEILPDITRERQFPIMTVSSPELSVSWFKPGIKS